MSIDILTDRVPPPYDPMCLRLAEDMEYLDTFWADSQEELAATPQEEYPQRRADYVRLHEGTYNKDNGHFLCDSCYIMAGMPTAPGGWVCP
jgi:hypothetical protein